jgi:cyclopropane fatty-acyl-phospholipid synthase-like methyltransferase
MGTRPKRPATSDRLQTIVERMRIRPDDVVLEIGCGHGVAATYVCERLRGGHFVAHDRSKKMITAAKLRNRQYVDSGLAEFHVADFLDFDPGTRRFDKIFAVRVGLFHREPARSRKLVEQWLAPGGKLFVAYDEP